MKNTSEWDARGLIADALAMDGLTPEETRSIFFDWAFGLADPMKAAEAATALLKLHKTDENAEHEMIRLLEQAVTAPPTDRRRNRRGRRSEDG